MERTRLPLNLFCYSQNTDSRASDLLLTRIFHKSHPMGHFLDAQLRLLTSSQSLLKIWKPLTFHSGYAQEEGLFGELEPPLHTTFWNIWKAYVERCKFGDLVHADREDTEPSMQDTDFELMIGPSDNRTDRFAETLDGIRKLAMETVEWHLDWEVAMARLPCLIPWVTNNRELDGMPIDYQRILDRLYEATGGVSVKGLPLGSNTSDFDVAAKDLEDLIRATMTTTNMLEIREPRIQPTEPDRLPETLQRALVEIYRERENGISRKELGTRITGRPENSTGIVGVADQLRHRLVNQHHYQLSKHPWKLDEQLLPSGHIEQIRDLDDLLSDQPLEERGS